MFRVPFLTMLIRGGLAAGLDTGLVFFPFDPWFCAI